jgi:biopolymer transport protein ExbD
MRLPEEPDTPFQINIVPMIDVLFAILTFFIMSSLFLTRSTGIGVVLPNAQTAEEQPPSAAEIVVTIAADGSLRLNQTPISLPQLQPQLRALTQAKPRLVVISADQRVPHGTVIMVMDQVRQVPGVELAIAADKP